MRRYVPLVLLVNVVAPSARESWSHMTGGSRGCPEIPPSFAATKDKVKRKQEKQPSEPLPEAFGGWLCPTGSRLTFYSLVACSFCTYKNSFVVLSAEGRDQLQFLCIYG